MTRKRKNKPSKPRVIVSAVAANDDEAKLVNVNLRASRAEAARLKAQGGEVNIDKTTGLIAGAWRKDVFTVLRAKRGKPCPGWPKGRPALSDRSHDAFTCQPELPEPSGAPTTSGPPLTAPQVKP